MTWFASLLWPSYSLSWFVAVIDMVVAVIFCGHHCCGRNFTGSTDCTWPQPSSSVTWFRGPWLGSLHCCGHHFNCHGLWPSFSVAVIVVAVIVQARVDRLHLRPNTHKYVTARVVSRLTRWDCLPGKTWPYRAVADELTLRRCPELI